MKWICVFCGSSLGAHRDYAETAGDLGRLLAERKLGLVNGGGNIGLMGVLSDAALAAGGKVIGVIPQALVDRELAHRRLTELRIVGSMHERKALMVELSDAFIALPGGYGTLDELCEVLTWAQLGIHTKPCGLLNVDGFYDPLLEQFDRAMIEKFVKPDQRAWLQVSEDAAALVDGLLAAPAPKSGRRAPGRRIAP